MDIGIVILGIGLGLLVIPAPGPVSLTLVEIGMRQGRRKGIEGGVGIALADAVALTAAATIVVGGRSLPPFAATALDVASVITLVVIGLLLVVRPLAASALAERIERPLPTMFSFTALTPSVLGMWVAVLNAVPFSTSVSAVAAFALGIVATSLGWHIALAMGASSVGSRLSERVQVRVMRAGGFGMLAFALATWMW